jgi:hypothetical protein
MPYITPPGHIRSATMSLDDDAIFIIGLISRWWAHIEFTVDSSLRDLINRPDTPNADTSLRLPFKQRLGMLRQLCALLAKDPATATAIDKAILRVGAHQHLRDLLVHGFVVQDSKRPQTHLYVSRITWSQPVRRQVRFISRAALYKFEPELGRTMMHLFMLTAGCHDPDSWPGSIDGSTILSTDR